MVGPEKTRKAVAELIASEIAAGSVLAPHVAAGIAETVMQGLLAQEYLIANGKIHTITQADRNGYDAADVDEAWTVYTKAETDEADDEHNGTHGG